MGGVWWRCGKVTNGRHSFVSMALEEMSSARGIWRWPCHPNSLSIVFRSVILTANPLRFPAWKKRRSATSTRFGKCNPTVLTT